ncbi:MAG: toxin-antitoxin system toxin component [Phormidium sp. OSCR]|nr:MAG: toxin-antitoxin system toxin component [Phormidium sp. OSCR]
MSYFSNTVRSGWLNLVSQNPDFNEAGTHPTPDTILRRGTRDFSNTVRSGWLNLVSQIPDLNEAGTHPTPISPLCKMNNSGRRRLIGLNPP